MKIALIAKRVSESHGGAERVAANVAARLSGAGHDVHVFTRRADAPLPGVQVHIIRTAGGPSPVRLISFRNRTAQAIAVNDFDIVYSLCQVYPVDIYRVGDGIHEHWMKLRYPHRFHRTLKYGTSLVHFAMRFLERKIMTTGNCRFFITNARLVRNQLTDYYGIPEDRIRVIYNGVDGKVFNRSVRDHRQELLQRHAIPAGSFVLLFLANNWERKGLSTVIGSLPRLKDIPLRLVVAGRGKSGPYRRMARDLGIQPERIIFAGPTTAVEEFYGMSDAIILPSRYEPFANVCLEAMACGLPVITTPDNGASELIRHGENGFVLSGWRDIDGASSAVRRLSDPRIREPLGLAASHTAAGFGWDVHTRETVDALEEVLEEKKRARPNVRTALPNR